MRLQTQRSVLDEMGVTYATHYFEKPELTAAQTAIEEAEGIIAAAGDYVGLPAADKKTAMTEALSDLKGDMENAAWYFSLMSLCAIGTCIMSR